MDCWVNLVRHPVWFQVRVSWMGNIAWSFIKCFFTARCTEGWLWVPFGLRPFLLCSDARGLLLYTLLQTHRMLAQHIPRTSLCLEPLCSPLSGWTRGLTAWRPHPSFQHPFGPVFPHPNWVPQHNYLWSPQCALLTQEQAWCPWQNDIYLFKAFAFKSCEGRASTWRELEVLKPL